MNLNHCTLMSKNGFPCLLQTGGYGALLRKRDGDLIHVRLRQEKAGDSRSLPRGEDSRSKPFSVTNRGEGHPGKGLKQDGAVFPLKYMIHPIPPGIVSGDTNIGARARQPTVVLKPFEKGKPLSCINNISKCLKNQ